MAQGEGPEFKPKYCKKKKKESERERKKKYESVVWKRKLIYRLKASIIYSMKL
jgi:hypothetical protein